MNDNISTLRLSDVLIGLRIMLNLDKMNDNMFKEFRTKIYDHNKNLNAFDAE